MSIRRKGKGDERGARAGKSRREIPADEARRSRETARQKVSKTPAGQSGKRWFDMIEWGQNRSERGANSLELEKG